MGPVAGPAAAPPLLLAYEVLPARAHPGRAAFGLTVILLVELVFLVLEESVFFAALAGFLLLASTSPFYFPTRVEIDATGVRLRHLGAVRQRRWDRLRRADVRAGGVLLSPFAKKSILDGPRGVFIPFGAEPERAALLSLVREHFS